MAKIKGCLNVDCVENAKRTKFKEDALYCSKCGNKLVYICPSCYKELADRNDKLCADCLQKKIDIKEKRRDGLKTAGGAVVAAVKMVDADTVKKVVNKKNVDKAVKVVRKVINK